MKTIDLPYGRGKQHLHVEESRLQAVLAPAHGEKQSESQQAIESVPPENTFMDQWEAQILARVMLKANCWFVTGEENRALIETMHMR